MFSCKKETAKQPPQDNIPSKVIAKIKAEGFSTHNIRKVKGGYIVEGDIFLSNDWLNQKQNGKTLLIAKTEQYRSNNLVTISGVTRQVTVSISGFPQVYTDALDEALARYNALNLRLTFQRVASGAELNIIQEDLPGSTLGQSGGYPTDQGNIAAFPIKLDAIAIGSFPSQAFIATVIAHEIGHCIGLRHTDYLDRTFSCSGDPNPNEGPQAEGAIHIPGTATAANADSWMLACIPPNIDRPFTYNDIQALQYLYGYSQVLPNGVYRFGNVNSGKMLDVYGQSQSEGARVTQWDFNGGSNQYWQVTYLGNGYYRLTAMHSGKALTFNPNAPVSRLEQATWTGNERQQWKIALAQFSQYVFECRYNKGVMDVWASSLSNDGRVTAWTWNGGANQRWYFYN
jgi:hypothetical protein